MISRIETIHLFPKLDDTLISLLKGLSGREWELPTLAGSWLVRDIAAHLLDGFLRTLSYARDRYAGEMPGSIRSYNELVDYLNRLNADWVRAMRRVSPRVLVELMETASVASTDYLATLDMDAPAIFPVAWAGQERSPNWFHIAREYTERWHHQQQIRHAVGQDAPLLETELYQPFLDTCMQALPHHYRDVPAAANDALRINVTGVSTWDLIHDGRQWRLSPPRPDPVRCDIIVPPGQAWMLFMNSLSHQEARHAIRVTGDRALAERFFTVRAVMV